MVTRFYVNSGGSPPLAALGFDSLWERTTDASRHPMARTKQNSALTDTAKQAGSTTDPWDVLHYQFQSEALPAAGTLSGTFRCRFLGFESNTGADAHPQVSVRVVSGDGSTMRGTAYAGGTQTVVSTTVEFDTTVSPGQNQRFPDTRDGNTLSSVVYQAGDRVVVEIGIRHFGAGATTQTTTIRRGDPTAGSDLNETANSVTDGVPWIEFSQTLFPLSPQVEANQLTIRNTAATSHIINLNTLGLASTDRIFVAVDTGRNNLSPGTTWPAGWIELSDTTNVTGTAYTLSCAYLDLSGSPPSSVTITTVNNTECAAVALRISNYDPATPPEIVTAIDTSDPPAITPSWPTIAGMIIAILASENGSFTYPFTDDQVVVTGFNAQVALCTTNVSGTVNPASFANVQNGLNVATVAMRPALATGATIPPRSRIVRHRASQRPRTYYP